MLIDQGTTEELTEDRLASALVDAPSRDGLVLQCGDGRTELVARRILASTDPSGAPDGPLHGVATVEYNHGLGAGKWAFVAADPSLQPTSAS